MERIYRFEINMRIEELEKLVAAGTQSGLKGPELRMWVDGERARLKAQREAERQTLERQWEAERQRLEKQHEAERQSQEKEIAKLRQQMEFLENLQKWRTSEASFATDSKAHLTKVEGIGETARQPHLPRSDLPVRALCGGFRDGLEPESMILLNGEHLVPKGPSREARTLMPKSRKMIPQKIQARLRESRLLLVDSPVQTQIRVKEAAHMGAAITQTDTSLYNVANGNEAARSECSGLLSYRKQIGTVLSEEFCKVQICSRNPKKKMSSLKIGMATPRTHKAEHSKKKCVITKKRVACLSSRCGDFA